MKRIFTEKTWVYIEAAFESDSIPGQVWLVCRRPDGRLICTCRGWQRSRTGTCRHTRAVEPPEVEAA